MTHTLLQRTIRLCRGLRRNAFAMLASLAIIVVASSRPAHAQSLELTHSQPSAGGGVSSGGEFSLLGSLAQVAAAPSSGGEFDVMGGFNPACEEDCGFADINCDGFINGADLAILLSSWGPCPPQESCRSDLDGNGTVGPPDLAILLGSWT